ncbi:MAG: hypothetical protein ACLFWF_11635 [Alphaproteobacteria bacterium]
MFTAIGALITHRAFAEHALDFWVAIIYHRSEGKKQESEIPGKFGRKVRFLNLCFRRIAALSPFADEGTAILDDLCALSDTRHYIIHGVISNYDADTGEITFTKLDLTDKNTMHKASEKKITHDQLVSDATTCAQLTERASNFSYALIEAFVPRHERRYIRRPF